MLLGCARALRRRRPLLSSAPHTCAQLRTCSRQPEEEEEEGLLLALWPPAGKGQAIPQQHRCKHTSQWMRRHVRDPYVRAATKENYRSRAAFKLKEMQAKARVIRPGDSVVDLGCAPGGWSEVAVELVKPPPASPSSSTSQQRQGCVVGIDLLPVQPPVAGATLLQGDFTDPARRAEVLRLATAPSLPSSEGGMAAVSAALLCPVDVVLSDLAPNFSGDSHTDHVRTLHLCYEVFDFAAEAFARSGKAARGRSSKAVGTVLCKFFKGREEAAFLARVKASYAEVRLLKPKASRSESSEVYVLARGFRGLTSGPESEPEPPEAVGAAAQEDWGK